MSLRGLGHDILVYIVFSYFLLGHGENGIDISGSQKSNSCLRVSQSNASQLLRINPSGALQASKGK